ncbi:hypothetical protein [Erythrobacter sp. MTPC3]|uniref:hypothetical protein n=1 Tax=Erythrobacter sp. MTPC3 TaxID=3056564 RepID=UPI0036F2787D
MGRPAIKLALQVVGAALFVSGAMWALQGLGILMWPAGSFMLAQREWALYGGVTALIGVVMILLGQRIGRGS